MFSFLNSGILVLAATAVIPLLIYLFAKKKPQKVVFSSIRHILQTQKSEKKKINLQDILLLIIRTLIILLTILAISRPTIKLPWIKSSASHPKTAVAIVVDNSYSMNYLVDTETEFEKAKQIANQINEQISNNDAAVLLTLDNSWNQLNSYLNYGKVPEEKIQSIKITAKPTSFEDILNEAAKLLKKSHYSNREIYVVSDRQQKKLPKLEEQVLYIPVSDVVNPVNISCQKASFRKDIIEKKYKITADLVNHSDFVQKDIVYSLFLDGATVSEKVTNLKPNQTKQIEFELQLSTPGSYTGFVNVREERLTYDNRSYFSFTFTPDPQTILLTNKTVPSALKAFLSVYTNNISVENFDNFAEEEVIASDNLLISLSHCDERVSYLLGKLNKLDKKYVLLTSKELTEECREIIQELFNTKIKEFSNEQTIISTIDQYHPVVQILQNKNLAPVRNFWQAETNARVLLAGNRWPLAVENKGDILLLFDISKANSRFLVNSAFPIFMNNTLHYTQKNGSYKRQLQVGSAFAVQGEEVILPDGSRLQTKKNRYFPTQPGIYTTASQKYAVNLKYKESDFEPIEFPKNIRVLEENWQQQIFTSRYGYEIWKLVLILVLLLFIWEMLLVKKRENR